LVKAHFDAQAQPRMAPTRDYQKKVKNLAELRTLVAQWRAAGDGDVGITSGVFDILHPGHISFLEDSSRQCGRLIAVIASDRTVAAQKGPEKPYINELKRAQTVAALATVDAVIISDEPYHETILKALSPDVLFKGDDYAGKTIMGAELVGRVELIPCAEKEFYSSSAFVRKIKTGERDKKPGWAPQ
jgi:D-beta-D-heptose 7-phosphate kinase / D-beta-D-heptose 1-phosphate adenosyltransferase